MPNANAEIHQFLRYMRLLDTSEEITYLNRNKLIDSLMNVTLKCLGSIRILTIENQNSLLADDCNRLIDDTNTKEKMSRLQREVFCDSIKVMSNAILSGEDFDINDPIKDLIECFPSSSREDHHWHMLNWTIMSNDITHSNMEDKSNESEEYHIKRVFGTLKYFPHLITEIDLKGQHYMYYAIRTNNVKFIERMLNYNPESSRYKDCNGCYLIHYAASYSQSIELLYIISKYMNKTLAALCVNYLDDDMNLPVHSGCIGNSTIQVFREMLFTFSDAAKVPNKSGKLPLHLACSNSNANLEKIRTLLAIFPQAISIPDGNGWLPIHHAVFSSKSLDVIEYLFECNRELLWKPHNPSGRIALHYAAVSCHSFKIMKFIMDKHPAGPKTMDTNRRLPLHNLIARCEYMTPVRLQCLQLLLQAYPFAVTMRGNDGLTPIDLAKRDNYSDYVLNLLLDAESAYLRDNVLSVRNTEVNNDHNNSTVHSQDMGNEEKG
eukprot:gene8452-11430_t